MLDGYFYKSLAATLFVYAVVMCVLIAFVLATGIVGVCIIGVIIIYFLCYFYDVFGNIKRSKRR